MRKTIYSFIGALLFLSGTSVVLSNVSFSPTAPTDPQPFAFTCAPYSAPFVSGGYYQPLEGGTCSFYLPAISGSQTVLAVYKGTPGNATLVENDVESYPYTEAQAFPNYFSGSQDADYFAVAYGINSIDELIGTDAYLETGAPLPIGIVINMVQWKWGTEPVVATTSPLTVTASSTTLQLGASIPTLSANLSGFISPNTATSSDVTGAASCSTTATNSSAPGTYPITCTVGTLTSTNYTFGPFIAGTLTIVDTTSPTVTIVSPTNGATYLKNAAVAANATAVDLSTIAKVVYTFNGAVIAAGSNLPLSSAPLGTSTVVVAATDSLGNVGYGTSTFKVAAVPPPPDTTPPTVTIASPIKNGIYAKTDTVFLTATVTDASAIATTTYWLNGVKINPAVKLALANAPLVSKVSGAAADAFGNTATSTLTFYVVKSTSSCLLDIITIATNLIQDKTIPDKPTIQNLIADCAALLKGLHHY